MEIKTTPGKWYSVTSASGCSVTLEDGTLVKECAAPQDFFNAPSGKVLVSDAAAIVRETFNSAPAAGSGGGAAIVKPATGETIVPLTSAELTIRHANWFDNAEQTDISIVPATWQNEVMTCYLKTSVPVELFGVTWIYGAPTMAAGYIYVIAMQQIDAATVLANLAYVLPQ